MASFFHQLPILSTIGLVLIFGFLGSRLARLARLPSVTGYIFAGVVVGKSFLGWILGEPASTTALILDTLSVAALGIIAFSIGAELRLDKFRRLGRRVFPIALAAALGATAAVAAAVVLLGVFFPGLLFPGAETRCLVSLALVLGAIASATAPAAILAVINEYRAKGPLADSLLATVAIDDVFCIMIFGVLFPVATALACPGGALTLSSVVLVPLREIVFSLLLGSLAALAMTASLRAVRGKSAHLVLILAAVFFLSGLAQRYHLSPLLTNMAFGCLVINLSPRSGLILGGIQSIEPPLFVAFFTIAGIHLDLGLLAGIGWLGLVYFLARAGGKMGGAALGARILEAPAAVRRYLGLGLLPQAGVAIGLVILVGDSPRLAGVALGGRPFADIVTNCILATVALNELIGPVAARFALRRAGEIAEDAG